MVVIELTGAHALYREFEAHDRDYFSWEGYVALFDYLSELAEGQGSPYAIDVVGLCGDFSEVEPDEFADYDDCELVSELDNGNRLYFNY